MRLEGVARAFLVILCNANVFLLQLFPEKSLLLRIRNKNVVKMALTLFPPRRIEGRVLLPSSKSICNRALILNALSGCPMPIGNLSDCDDTRVMVRAFESDGPDFDILAAGTAMRFLTAYLSQCTGVWTITGSERMRHRPIRLLVDALRSLGACIEYLGEEGFPPLRIEGKPLRGGDLTLSAGVSSQYISALLMIAPYMQEGLSLTLTGTMISKPYIAMTLAMMRHWGVGSRWEGNRIEVAPAAYKPLAFTVESDWSAASYWYEMVSLTPGAVVELPGLQRESVQGDARVADFYAALGVDTEFAADGVRLRHTGQTTTAPLLLDLTDQPDLAQTLVVTCALSQRPFRFTGLQSLKIKETDRIAALKCELAKLGYPIVDSDDSALSWDGRRADAAGHPAIDTYDDHRMAMAFAPAAMFFPGLEIRNPEVVSKSYPAFWDHLRQVGFDVRTLK